jgi:hypothetical protein
MRRAGFVLLAILVVSAIYLAAWPAPNLVYPAVVLAHAGFGLLFALLGIRLLPRALKESMLCKVGGVLLAIGTIIGIVLIFTGTSRPSRYALLAHIVICVLAVVMLAAWWMQKRNAAPARSAWGFAAAFLIVAVGVSAGSWYTRQSWSKQYIIRNPSSAPLSMDDEGDGANGMFFPSSAQVAGKRKIPAKFFMESDACARCHQDIYNQWQRSAHHFSSFNNQWYRKSIEYMQDVRGTKPSKWCAGCHDPALIYSGMMDTPIRQIVHRPEAQAGLGCMMCHSITKVKSTMGQADFMLEYPELHELAATKNPVMRALHDFTIKLNPEPHRRVFLKPFMKDQTAEFCSSCHKVHLDVPVNNYRWFRGFNEYDNWQASGVSGLGARSFYYPPKPQQCADCHMPSAKSKDFANVEPGCRPDEIGGELPEVGRAYRRHFCDLARSGREEWRNGAEREFDDLRSRRRGRSEDDGSTGSAGNSDQRAYRSGRSGLASWRQCACRCRGTHPQSRALLPGRHGRCFRYLAGTQGRG